jgi:hypothetical protein
MASRFGVPPLVATATTASLSSSSTSAEFATLGGDGVLLSDAGSGSLDPAVAESSHGDLESRKVDISPRHGQNPQLSSSLARSVYVVSNFSFLWENECVSGTLTLRTGAW